MVIDISIDDITRLIYTTEAIQECIYDAKDTSSDKAVSTVLLHDPPTPPSTPVQQHVVNVTQVSTQPSNLLIRNLHVKTLPTVGVFI